MMSLFIHHLTGGWSPRGEEAKGKEGEDYWDMAYIHFSDPSRGGREER